MEKHGCGICGRRFSNGRALGGHMRSHMIAAKTALRPPPPPAPPSSSSSSSLSAAVSSSVVQEGESEAELSIDPIARRHKRHALEDSPDADFLTSSSASDVTTEEDVARCLVMLSRDAWARSAAVADQDHRQSDEEDRVVGKSKRRMRLEESGSSRQVHECVTCKRVFGSYHALGGHRAGYKKLGASCAPPEVRQQIPVYQGVHRRRIHECPFCFRIFSSGQALGGHKKSHLMIASATRVAPPPPTYIAENSVSRAPAAVREPRESRYFDLNLPAQETDLSAVSNADR